MSWKLAQTEPQPLACIAEELALNAIIMQAESHVEHRKQEADFGGLRDSAFEDHDFQCLWHMDEHGRLQLPIQRIPPGTTPLDFDEWFSPIAGGTRGPVHPYAAERPG